MVLTKNFYSRGRVWDVVLSEDGLEIETVPITDYASSYVKADVKEDWLGAVKRLGTVE